MTNFYHIKSIAEIHTSFGLPAPLHPLITIIKKWPLVDFNFKNVKITSDLYVIGMKGNTTGSFSYGQNSYDYKEGTLVFMSPNQVAKFDNVDSKAHPNGWDIIFHPDLLRKSDLGKTIKNYSFFNYGINEALHVSDREKSMLMDLIMRIELELTQNIDKHSHELILSNLDSVLKYCSRYYERQFSTRTKLNKGYVARFEQYLEKYFNSDDLFERGMLSITECGKALNMSGSYLSDLIKLETGKSAKFHIHSYVIKKAKLLLLSSNFTISQVGYFLGFKHPQHFSKFFKNKVGKSPTEFRKIN